MDERRDEPIRIRGARVHNLKDLDCDIPRQRLVVITGPSGSGKSSLAFDTLYAEGQRRYVESLSPWARQFLEQMERPAVESVSGLSPAIAIEQRTTVAHPRSTVGTVSEVYDHLRVLFASLGKPHCPRCAEPIAAQGADEMARRLVEQADGLVAVVAAPVARGRKGGYRKELAAARAGGLQRARIDGRAASLLEPVRLDPRRTHRIDVLVDRLALREGTLERLRASLQKALDLASGVVLVSVEGKGERLLSQKLACARCDVSVPELSPRSFSFNSAQGACPACDGLGLRWAVEAERVMPDESKSLLEGAIRPWHRHGPRLLREALFEVAERHGFSLEVPVSDLSAEAKAVLLHGDEEGFPGVVPYLRKRVDALLRLDPQPAEEEGADGGEAFDDLRPYLTEEPCRACRGTRLRPESLAVRVAGMSVADVVRLPLSRARETLAALAFPEREQPVAERVVGEILSRLDVLASLGLGYLALDRATTTLSGGEAHRLRLATQIGARMQGLLYVLDEPSVGLHQRDNARLIQTLRSIRDAGNTVVVVEHDEETIRAADWVLDLGEGAGASGGRLDVRGPAGDDRRQPHRPLPPRRAAGAGAARAPRREGLAARARGARAQPPRYRRLGPARDADGGDRSLRLGQVDARRGRAPPRARAPALPRERRAGPPRGPRGRGSDRQGDRDRPEPDRPHPALEPRDVHGGLRPRAGALQPAARGPRARLPAGPLLVQREGRPVRGVPGRRRPARGDALPPRRVRPVRGVRRAPLQPRDARGALPGALDRRRPRPQRRRRARAALRAPAPCAPPRRRCRRWASATCASARARRRSRAARHSGCG